PEKNNYVFMMEDIERDWNFSGYRNYVSYANMKPGTYYFTVKSINPDNKWSSSEARLKITIIPPFWKTLWFLTLEILAALVLIVYIYTLLVKVRTNRILKIQNERIRLANIKLAESEKDLVELNATKDKFFSIISHDLKNPFSSLLAISDILLENFKISPEKENISGIRKIQESVKQIYNLLENLLTWSRVQTGRLEFEPVNFNLSNVIQENLNLHRLAAEKKGIILLSDIPDDLMVYGDREMINAVIRNLISNAVKYTGKGGKIRCEVKTKGSFYEVLVIDQGVGISEENLQRLFRIDMKLKTRGTSGEKGTGLGLILCKEFIEKNGGEMIVKSIRDKGSEFGFSIPRARK
ncbi:MAG: hypothetical protein JSV24_08730, partial [Bacteroidales bacterium]